jgi:prepilin-type N-terminal cleavage/methylation domain-containing protein
MKWLKKSKGFGLIEVIIAIAISAGAAYYFLVQVPQAKEANLIEKEIANINTIVAAVQNIYGASQNYSSLTNAVLINANAIPSSMINNGSIINSWGGNVVVSGTVGKYTISEYSISYAPCFKMVINLSRTVNSMAVNGYTVQSFDAPLASMETISSACWDSTPATLELIFR